MVKSGTVSLTFGGMILILEDFAGNVLQIAELSSNYMGSYSVDIKEYKVCDTPAMDSKVG